IEVSRKPGTYPPMNSAPPVALTFKKVRILRVFVVIRHLVKRRPRDEWRGGCVDMFRIGRCCPTWRGRFLHLFVLVFSRATPRRTSTVQTDSSRIAGPAPRSRPLAADGSMRPTSLRLS